MQNLTWRFNRLLIAAGLILPMLALSVYSDEISTVGFVRITDVNRQPAPAEDKPEATVATPKDAAADTPSESKEDGADAAEQDAAGAEAGATGSTDAGGCSGSASCGTGCICGANCQCDPSCGCTSGACSSGACASAGTCPHGSCQHGCQHGNCQAWDSDGVIYHSPYDDDAFTCVHTAPNIYTINDIKYDYRRVSDWTKENAYSDSWYSEDGDYVPAPRTGSRLKSRWNCWWGGQTWAFRARMRQQSCHLANQLRAKFAYFTPTGCCGEGCPPVGTYQMIYAVDPQHFDQRDGMIFAAPATGVPMSVPLAPTVNYTMNYGRGIPSSRITPITRVLPRR